MLKEMLSEGSKISSKRVITFVALIVVVISYLSEQFFKLIVDNEKFNYMIYLVEVGLGTVALDNISKYFGKNKVDEPS